MKRHRHIFITVSLFALLAQLMVSCGPSYKTAYEQYKAREFDKAIVTFKKILPKSEDSRIGKINFLIAESYRLSGRLDEATPYYAQANREKYLNNNLGLYYGLALKKQGKYKEALAHFEHFAKIGTHRDYVKKAKAEADFLHRIDTVLKKKSFIEATPMTEINSPTYDYAAKPFFGGLVFTSTRRKEQISPANGSGYSDIYASNVNDSKKLELLNALFAKDGLHDRDIAFSPDGTYAVFSQSYDNKDYNPDRYINLLVSEYVDGAWSAPKILPQSNKRAKDISPYIAEDGTLFFASNRPGGAGGFDIYKAKHKGKASWELPRNLGKSINTIGDEVYPYVSKDKHLYFSSDGHMGIGGLDIFVATKHSGSIKVSSIGPPFNSSGDDFAIYFENENLKEEKGYFTSDRQSEGAKGKTDIYSFEYVPPRYVYYYFKGKTAYATDSTSGALDSVSVTLKADTGTEYETVLSDSIGAFSFSAKIDIGRTYTFEVHKAGYDMLKVMYNTSNDGVDSSTLNQEVTNIFLDTTITLKPNIFAELGASHELSLNNILYDPNDYKIRPDAAKELDKLVAFLKESADIRVELGSHTDSRGESTYNMELSTKRAQAAVDYVISKGIDSERVVAHGYGETKLLIADAETEEQHQLNRRTTIAVITEETASNEEPAEGETTEGEAEGSNDEKTSETESSEEE